MSSVKTMRWHESICGVRCDCFFDKQNLHCRLNKNHETLDVNGVPAGNCCQGRILCLHAQQGQPTRSQEHRGDSCGGCGDAVGYGGGGGEFNHCPQWYSVHIIRASRLVSSFHGCFVASCFVARCFWIQLSTDGAARPELGIPACLGHWSFSASRTRVTSL